MKKNRGIAVIPLIIVIVLAGVAGFSIFSWVKTSKQAQADKEVAEQRERDFKVALDDAQQEAEDNANKAAELDEKLTKTEEAMKLAEEKAQKDAEEKAAMIAELEEKYAQEEEAKKAAEEKSENLANEIASLEESIEAAKEREYALRASLGGSMTRINPKAAAGLQKVASSLDIQKDSLASIKSLLTSGGSQVDAAKLKALIASFEEGVISAEKSTAELKKDLVNSGEFSSSSEVGQAVSDLQQTTRKQRAILNSLKSMIANSGDSVDIARVKSMIFDLEASVSELEERQSSLDSIIQKQASVGDSSAAIANFEKTIRKAQSDLAAMKRQLATAEAEKSAAIERQKELERLSIEIRYDINYEARSFSYARRLHSMYDSVANPVEEK